MLDSEKRNKRIALALSVFNDEAQKYIGKSLDVSYKIENNLPWIKWGPNNDLPYWLADISHSNTHKQLLDLKTILVRGANFLFDETKFSELNDYITTNKTYTAYEKAALDKVYLNGFALQILWAKNGKTIADVKHLPLPTLRLENPAYFNRTEPENVYISNDWRQYKKPGFEPQIVPLFNPEKAKEEPIQILYDYEYALNNFFYPVEDYRAALNHILCERELGLYDLSTVQNNFVLAAIIQILDDTMTDEEAQRFVADLKQQFTGARNGNKLMAVNGKIDVTTLPTNNNADIYKVLDEKCVQKIISAHKLNSPALAGLPGGGSVFNSEISIAFEYFENTVIRNYQRSLLSAFAQIFMINKLIEKPSDISIESLNAIQFKFSENVLLPSLTKNEIRSELGYAPRTDGNDYVRNEGQAQAQAGLNPSPSQTPNTIPGTTNKDLPGQDLAPNNLRTTVGGITGILSIQSSVAAGTTDYESAITMLTELYGFDEATARKMIGSPKQATSNNTPQ